MTRQSLHSLADEALLRRLAATLRDSRRVEADLVALIAEVEARGLYLREACSSMFSYCLERLHLSEPETNLRLAVARAVRERPVLLDMLRDGRLHLTAIALVAPHLTDANCADVLERATHRSKARVQELVAELAPRADAPTLVRRLPAPRSSAIGSRPRLLDLSATDSQGQLKDAAAQADPNEQRTSAPPSPESSPGAGSTPTPASDREAAPRPDEVRPAVRSGAVAPPAAPSRASIQPTAPERYRVQFTASAQLKQKLERLQTLMLSSVPDGDLAAVIEAAVTAEIERLEARRLGAAQKPRKTVAESDTRPGPRHIPSAVKRAVRARDGDQCAYVGKDGRRCSERRHLQFHHRRPHGFGGDRSPENISLRCARHNRYEAEHDYGRLGGPRRPRLDEARKARGFVQSAATSAMRPGLVAE
jgi:hypothetical protein